MNNRLCTVQLFFQITYQVLLVLACLLVVSVSVRHVKAQGPIRTIYSIEDQVDINYGILNEINDTITKLNLEDIRLYDERLDGLEELLRTAFLDIGERFQAIENKLDDIEGTLDDIQSKLVNPLQATHWITPFFERKHYHYRSLQLVH